MAVIGPTLFGVVLWGVIAAVACVFVYEVSVVLSEAGAFEGR